MNISNNIVSINSSQTLLNTSAKNIANSSPDLAKDLTNQIIAQDTTAVNVNAIKTQDEMLGSLLDIKA
ncbi:MAG: hypothetical protein Q9M32_04210 [Sulfurimonas sp.]|nr:hypothetical protein [Sulfurimonas sp.]MDQ7061985.1 hypothetical protein [Sulfurimonas sp.]